MMNTWGAATDVGRVRSVNEDAFLARSPIYLIADGMGGHDAGSVASSVVVAECTRLDGRDWVTIDDLQECFGRAVARMRTAFDGRTGGATAAGVAHAEQAGSAYWLVFNIGDSRVYRMVGGELTQVSVDHSVVQELIESGALDPSRVSQHAARHVVTRALSSNAPFEVDYWLIPLTPDDRMLICSDGLTNEVPDHLIGAILTTLPDPQVAAEQLVAAALAAGGRDNVSVIVVDAATMLSDLQHLNSASAPPGRLDPASPSECEWDELRHGGTQPRMREATS
jgi:PPM family protein phosphatase